MITDGEIKDAQSALGMIIRRLSLTQEEVELLLYRGIDSVKMKRIREQLNPPD